MSCRHLSRRFERTPCFPSPVFPRNAVHIQGSGPIRAGVGWDFTEAISRNAVSWERGAALHRNADDYSAE